MYVGLERYKVLFFDQKKPSSLNITFDNRKYAK